MSRNNGVLSLSVAMVLGIAGTCGAQYGGVRIGGAQPVAADQLRAAVRTLLLQVDHLLEDMEVDLVREPLSERLLQTAYDVRDEVEHLASSVERGVDYNHAVRDFQEFDVQWHRLTRQASRFAGDDRHLQRNLSRVSQTDSDLHRLLRLPPPVDVQEVRALTAALQRAVEHLREDIQIDLRGLRYQRALLAQAATLEASTEHLAVCFDRGADVSQIQRDFQTLDGAWLQLAEGLRDLSSMRFDHIVRAADEVATAEGRLRTALGLEANPNQFTCFRPPPSDMRRTLPYAANGSTVVIPNGWRVAPPPAGTYRTYEPNADDPALRNTPEPGLSLVLGFLFGGDVREPKAERPRHSRLDDADEDSERDHDDRPAVQPVKSNNFATPKGNALAPIPPKPVDPTVQAKIDKNLAKLSADSRTAAVAQRTCPVKGELLGSHGVPIKVKVKVGPGVRRDIFVCCDDCEDELQDHPERYLDRIKAQD